MEAVSDTSGFGTLFEKVGSIGNTAVESSRPTLRERVLRSENRDLSSENVRLKTENRDLRSENRDLQSENRTLEGDLRVAEQPAPPSAEPIEAPRQESPRNSDSEAITAPKASAPPPPPPPPANEAPSAPPTSPAGIYQANAGSGGTGALFNAFA